MRRAIVLLTIVGVTSIVIASIPYARKSARDTRKKSPKPVTTYHTGGLSDLPLDHPSRARFAALDTTVLAEYTFDTGGAPDPMGWIGADRTAQVDTFFHVADATELNGGTYGGLQVLEGNQSLWCGAYNQMNPALCYYMTLPGYGNHWDQRFESVTFSTDADTMNFSWKISWDSEPGPEPEYTYVEYMDSTGQWVALPVNGGTYSYQGVGVATESHQIAGDIGSGGAAATRFRFRFVSDGGWSDEDGLWDTDGACIVDSILVTTQNGDTLC
jgi:hypothetical protein